MDYSDNKPQSQDVQICTYCDDDILVMAFRGTGVCSLICQKARDGEINATQWTKLRLERVWGPKVRSESKPSD